MYVVNERGIYRYLNRNPADDPATSDHCMAQTQSGDFRKLLRGAVANLPSAPCCIVLCLREAHAQQYYAQLEVGFVAGNMLMQAAAVDLGCHFRVKLSPQECQRIQSVAGIPENHVPQSILSVGRATGWPYRARTP
jgi:hypothetical protein